MSLSDSDKARVVYHLGYPDANVAVSSYAGGVREYDLVLELHSAMDNINATAVSRVKAIIQNLDQIEEQMIAAPSRMRVTKLDTLTMNASETEQLEGEYRRWAHRLAELIGSKPNPYSKRFGNNHVIPRVL